MPFTRANCLWVSPIFTTINKDGTSRLILNLKRLNLFIAHIHFKMESIQDVINMIKPGVWMASVDLHHAYYSMPVHESHRPYFLVFMARHLLPLPPPSQWLCPSSSTFYQNHEDALLLFTKPGPFIGYLYGCFLSSGGLRLLLSEQCS